MRRKVQVQLKIGNNLSSFFCFQPRALEQFSPRAPELGITLKNQERAIAMNQNNSVGEDFTPRSSSDMLVRNSVEQRFLSLKQISVYLGLSSKTLYHWAEEGRIPGYKLGRVWRFDREQIDLFVRSNGGR